MAQVENFGLKHVNQPIEIMQVSAQNPRES